MDESEHEMDTASVSCVHARTWILLLSVVQTRGLKCRVVNTPRVKEAMLGVEPKDLSPTALCSSMNAALFTALHNPQDCQGDFNYVINQSRSFYHVHMYAGSYVCMVLGTEPATFLY